MKRNKKSPQKAALEAAKAFADPSASAADPQGSYTGCPKNKTEQPVQDADDL